MPPFDLPTRDAPTDDRTVGGVSAGDTCEVQAPGHTSPSASLTPWEALLQLGFTARERGTFLALRRHRGPLRVQKPLYPEGPDICHATVVHPPGGIAGGDALRIDIDVAANSHAVLATPGATKWYKSNRRAASQTISLCVGPNARLDWLPQNNILFDDARVALDLTLEIDETGSAIGWEATQLGRQASGERWRNGSLHATTTLRRPDGQLLWTERAILHADDPLRDAPQGLDGWGAFGTLWAIGSLSDSDSHICSDGDNGSTSKVNRPPPLWESDTHRQLVALLPYDDEIRSGITILPEGVVLIRVVARKMEKLQSLLVQCWSILRPAIHKVPSQPLRLWQT